MNRYTLYGLSIQSDIVFHDLMPANYEGEVQVFVRYGKIAEIRASDVQAERVFRQTPAGILLTWRDYGSFLISQGCNVLVQPALGAQESVISHLLIGPVFSVLTFQRSMAIFHASAVALSAGSVAFMAAKGYGKSTQAAAFLQRGGSLVTDDLLVLQVAKDLVWAAPGVPFLKLWPEAITHLGSDPATHPLVKDNMLKRTTNQSAVFVTQPTALRAVFLLDHGLEMEIKQLSKHEALRNILPHWYGALFDGDLLPILGIERQFLDCTTLVERVPTYRLKRPVALDGLSAICQAIECVL